MEKEVSYILTISGSVSIITSDKQPEQSFHLQCSEVSFSLASKCLPSLLYQVVPSHLFKHHHPSELVTHEITLEQTC